MVKMFPEKELGQVFLSDPVACHLQKKACGEMNYFLG